MRVGRLSVLIVVCASLASCIIEGEFSNAAVTVVSTSAEPVVGYQQDRPDQGNRKANVQTISGEANFNSGFDEETGLSRYDYFVIADAETGEVLYRRDLAQEPLSLKDRLVWDGSELRQLDEGEKFPEDIYVAPTQTPTSSDG